MNELRQAQKMGVLHLKDIDWYFRVYLMQGDPSESISRDKLFSNLESNVRAVAGACLSAEFAYIRSGYILAHYGRRGVAHCVWHWADWSGNWEYFCQAFYCYGRTVDKMSLLDRTEPILCLHELEVVVNEAVAFRDIAAKYSSFEEVLKHYRDSEPVRNNRPIE